MAGVEKVVEKVPGWVERLLIPTLESRVRAAVREEVGHLEKTMNARFDAVNTMFDAVNTKFDGVNTKFDAMNTKFDAVNARLDSLEQRIPMMQDIADLKARLTNIEKHAAG